MVVWAKNLAVLKYFSNALKYFSNALKSLYKILKVVFFIYIDEENYTGDISDMPKMTGDKDKEPTTNLKIFPGRQSKDNPLDKDRLAALKEWRDTEMKEFRVSMPKDNKNPIPQQIADAIIACDGFIMKAAIRLKISYGKIHKLIKKYPKLQSIIKDSTEAFLDLTESKLRDAILA